MTPFTGSACSIPAPVATFDCLTSYRATLVARRPSHTDDITVRFRTRKPNGILFKTYYDYAEDSIEAVLRDGRVVLGVTLGNEGKVGLITNHVLCLKFAAFVHVTERCVLQSISLCNDRASFNDDLWHFLRIHRAAGTVHAWVDDCDKTELELEGANFKLNVDEVYFGQNKQGDGECFMGHMQSFVFNEVNIFDQIRNFSQQGV